MTGNAPVSVGMALALQIFVSGDPEPLLIDRATVKWVISLFARSSIGC